mmetsp:Transcript_10178/g.10503  ORF Transcript_10178/g.10503 Transcript_10178/m.10503 type:complete len:355 (-) Transcript_10178:179-1243(-)|eukprot:CAMPEP_0170524746 /NCGR_PEP_ID=MMETSP0209-20121228/10203_1 /TAXON_ID=665100 ORGANISM="Litonotus pictus, Strain P1" /NCGR_SAMPLE_ID=MMETSP0209 /ASSEMBLY_ACC=CAM_ASM_000301 /LENGTH=354 /DNA_ID=CAMNT_0010813611 /DNA_START=1502 /DNA_END=2566 /DNA_ORIENTATION=+
MEQINQLAKQLLIKMERVPQSPNVMSMKDDLKSIESLSNIPATTILLQKHKKKAKGKKVSAQCTKFYLRAKNFEFIYPKNAPSSEIFKVLVNNFKKSEIKMRDREAKTFFVSCPKIKTITTHNKFKVNKKAPEIQTFSYDMLVKLGKLKLPDTTKMKEALISFFEDPNLIDCRSISEEIKNALSSTKIHTHSEYVLSSIVFNYIKEVGVDTKWEKLEIFSIDTKMESYEIFNLEKSNKHPFRCDMVAFYGEKIFVLEFKYRKDRKYSMAKTAMDCIAKRRYIERVIYYLNNHQKSMITGKSSIVGVGIGYTIKADEIHVDTNFVVKNLETAYIATIKANGEKTAQPIGKMAIDD